MSDTPAHDWLRPRLAELVRQAELAGLERSTVIAILTDLITAPPFNEDLVNEGLGSQDPAD
jgi:hypothetical protein